MNPRRQRALLVLGVVIMVVVLVVATMAGISEQRRLDRAGTADTAQRALITSTRASTAGQRAAIESAYLAAVKLTESVAGQNVDITVTVGELAIAKAALANAQAVLAASTGRRDFVQQCLVGVRQALDATQRRETAAATLYLRNAAASCEAALTPPGEAPPALAYDFPDPFVLRTGNGYLAYATNAAGGAVQKARSSNLLRWELAGDALTALPSWAVPGATWAPAAIQRPNETLLYYTVRQKSPDRLCISVAASASPEGPFIDRTSGPLECGGSSAIDPSPFVAPSGQLYLLFKAERPSRIYSRPLNPDGRSFSGPAQLMLTPTQRWESGVVEAPSMLRNGSQYWLFYSGNDWNSKSYAEGVARCDGPVGPCHALGRNPVLSTDGRVVSPGGGEVFTDAGGGWWMAYHAYQDPLVKYPNSRLLRIARVGFSGDGSPAVTP
jgi:hypothetical protein